MLGLCDAKLPLFLTENAQYVSGNRLHEKISRGDAVDLNPGARRKPSDALGGNGEAIDGDVRAMVDTVHDRPGELR